MPGFLDQVRHTKDKAALEADKLIRIRREQGAIGDLRRDIQAQQEKLGAAALALYRSGELAHPQLAAIGQRIESLEAQIRQREAKIEEIRAEQLPAPAEAGLKCARCGAALVAGAAFCPACGAAAAKPAPAPKPAPAAVCTGCGKPVDPAAAFCPFCGKRRVGEAPASRCAKCGAALVPEAVFCPECGAPVVQGPAAPVPGPDLQPPSAAPAAEQPVQPAGESTAEAPAEPAVELRAEPEAEPAGEPEVRLPAELPAEPAVEPPAAPPEEPAADIEPFGLDTLAAEALAPAGKACPSCGSPLPDEASFCPECGYRLA